jgi:tetratricopeptide (TPR) repeat protein
MANPVSNPEAEGRSDRLDELGKAERLDRKRLREDPADVEALCGMEAVCQDRSRLDEAPAYYHEARRQRPNDSEACRSLGNAFYLRGKYAEAASCSQRTLRLRSDDAEAHNNPGVALTDQGRLEEAVASDQEALRLRPDFAKGYTNLGNALRLQGRLLEATAGHQKAVQLAPGFALAQHNLGLALDDWRWRCADSSIPQFRQSAWDSSPWDGRTLLLYTEQELGLGDTLLFVRFVPQVKERGGRVVLAAPEALRATRDALRQYERAGDFGPRFVALARSLAHASDRRDQLRREINERLAGVRREESQMKNVR